MSRKIYLLFVLISFNIYSQEHFTGLNNSSRVGLISTNLNPAELSNIYNKFEVNGFGLSINVANNIVGFSDLTSDTDIEELIFAGNQTVNMRVDTQIYGLGLALKLKKWSFGLTTKINGKLDVVDIDPNLGDAIVNQGINSIIGSTNISNNYNQKFSGLTWGEVGLSASRNIIDKEKYRVNIGGSLKLLFPGSYANLGLDKFNGTVTNTGGQVYLNNTTANLNVAYSGGLSESFTTFNDYSKSVFGGLNGFATDFGINFQIKDKPEENLKKNLNKYKLNTGLAIKNIGSMTYKDDNNYYTNYTLNIQPTIANPLGLNLNQFEDIDNLQDIETILINNGYLNKIAPEKKEFKVKLPTVVSAYADIKLVSKLFVSAHLQQKLASDNDNDQIAFQNTITVTPRINLGFFEAYVPLSNSEVSGFNTGIGFRLGGFYIGSGSIVSAVINDAKQADFYTGFRWAFL